MPWHTAHDDARPLVKAAKKGDGCELLRLLKEGSGDVHDTDARGSSLYKIIEGTIFRDPDQRRHGEPLLRELLLKKAAPPDFNIASSYDAQLQEGMLLRRRLPHYLENREKLVLANCPLLRPLLDIVLAYDWLTVDERWKTGLGTEQDETKWLGPKIPEKSLLLTHKRESRKRKGDLD